jgi:NADH-quinone oxidoreductase subunit L
MSSGVALGIGITGALVAWVIYGAKRVRAPKALPVLEHKFYWDELYDLLWYRPADLTARGLAAFVERPLIGGSLTALTESLSLGSRELGRAQSGLVRSYALALAGGLAILVVVFLSVR